MNNGELITIKARLRLKTTDEGGRWCGIQSRYRPNHVFEYNRKGNFIATYIGEVLFDKEWIQPGESEIVTIKFLRDRDIADYMQVGRKWWVHEGQRLVGEGEIVEV